MRLALLTRPMGYSLLVLVQLLEMVAKVRASTDATRTLMVPWRL